MPNWCFNELTVTGDPGDVAAFIARVDGRDADTGEPSPLTFSAHVPDRVADGRDAWGTDRDALHRPPMHAVGAGPDATLDAGAAGWTPVPGGAQITFRTAWSPPDQWLAAVGRAEPALAFRLRYADAGNGFAGQLTVTGGDVTEVGLEVEDVLAPEQRWF